MAMKKIQTIIATLGILLLFSCEEKDGMGSRVGYLRLSVGESNAVETKADEEPAYDPKAFAVKITDKETSAVVEEFDAWAVDESKLIELKEGSYVISASSANYDEEPGFNKPYYAGSKEVAIKANDELNETLTCTLANVKVSVVFDEKLLEKYADRTISVSVSATGGTPMNFGKDNCGRDVQAYFPAGDNLTAKISITKPSGETGVYSSEYTIEKAKAKHYYVLTYKLESTGSGDFNITYNPDGWTEYNYNFPVNPVASNVATLSANAWAKFAYLTASGAKSATGAAPVNPKLQYRQQGTDVWNDLETTTTGEGDDAVYTATATSLAPNTRYEYRLVGDNDYAVTPMSFTTEEATELTNGGFESWITLDDGKTLSPNASTSYLFWDTSNKGANTIGTNNPTKDVDSPLNTKNEVPGGKAAELKSIAVLGSFFAAASLYTGTLINTDLKTQSADMEFGKSFTARPIALHGFYQYTPAVINKVDRVPDGVTIEEGKTMDQCAIYIALATKSFTFNNKNEDQYIDYANDPAIIAYGELPSGGAAKAEDNNGYVEFNIPLKYNSLTEKPTHIIIVCSSSKYGDYMTGGVGSTLYVDDFSLIYDGEPQVKE